jgi:hypothetical protein
MSRLAAAKTGSTNWPEFGFTATGTVVTFAKNTRLPKFLGLKVTTTWSCSLTSIPLTRRLIQLFYLGSHAVY